MKQVYYTQCPLGYGLGATNGFQVKRLDPGYPTSGDFRHLGLRAFLPGSRTLAPPALRYRQDGDVAEVAWLTPRTHEYETEQGRLWGRPGGQFAHGLRLEAEQLAALEHWPAGLYGRAFWKASDPERTLGRPPDPLQVSRSDLRCEPDPAVVSAFIAGIPVPRLAAWLAALARVVAEGRCLFLVAPADRLGDLVGWLTFAFPGALRLDLTFSTYHDRPEELAGFRIQGTLAEARPNRLILETLGTTVELNADPPEVLAPPPAWALTLAAWAAAADTTGLAAWHRTAGRLARMREFPPIPERWSDAWLDPLIRFDERTSVPVTRPADPARWVAETELARWAAASGLAAPWLEARPASWWTSGPAPGETEGAEESFVAHARMALAIARRPGEGAGTGSASEWGEAAARWFAALDPGLLAAGASNLLKAAPPELRGAFLAALVHGLSFEQGEDLLHRLADDPAFDPALLLPIEASRLAMLIGDGREVADFDQVLGRVLATPAAVVSTFEAIASNLDPGSEARPVVSRLLAARLEDPYTPGWDHAWRWALARPDSSSWLGLFVRKLAAEDDRAELRESLLKRTPAPLLPGFARAVLESTADDPGLADTFVWAIEAVLLRVDPARRPSRPEWPERYIGRLSGLDLTRRLYLRFTRDRRINQWLADAHRQGQVGAVSLERLRRAREFAKALEEQDLRAISSLVFPDVPPEQRGDLLSELRLAFGDDPADALEPCLDACVRNWTPAAFRAGEAGLAGLGRSLAEALRDRVQTPDRWVASLLRLIDAAAAPGESNGQSFRENGLAAFVLAATTASDDLDAPARWAIRNAVFRQERAWRGLARDLGRSLECPPGKSLRSALEQWDRGLVRGSEELETRFSTLTLNACPSPMALLTAVEEHAPRLASLGDMPAWSDGDSRALDLREAFARRAPMIPIAAGRLHAIRRWMKRAASGPGPTFDLDGLDLLPASPTAVTPDPAAAFPCLSPAAFARWQSLDALSVYARPGLGVMDQWNSITAWIREPLPLKNVSVDDRHAFIAQVIARLEVFDPDDLAHLRRLQTLARWLVAQGVSQPTRVWNWPQDLQGGPVAGVSERDRKPLVRSLCQELQEELERHRTRTPPAPTGNSTNSP